MDQFMIKEYHRDFPPRAYFSSWQGEHAMPKVFRQLIPDWPIVQAGKQAEFSSLKAYLLGIADETRPTTMFVASKSFNGRYGYGPSLREFNFEAHAKTPVQILGAIEENLPDDSRFNVYAGSMDADRYFPNLALKNQLPFDLPEVRPSVWVGTKSKIATHFDASQNIACVVAGKRRFTLFPPSQTKNMYLGPLDFTPAGQCISLVDPDAPDLQRFPRFAEALKYRVTVELEPGDAIFIPAMWWHCVESEGPFGALMNFWWSSEPKAAVDPSVSLLASFLSLHHLPQSERSAWLDLFKYFVFEDSETNSQHLTNTERGVLGDRSLNRDKTLLSYIKKSLPSDLE